MATTANQSVNEWLSDILAALGGSAGNASAALQRVHGSVAAGTSVTGVNPVLMGGVNSGTVQPPGVFGGSADALSAGIGFYLQSYSMGVALNAAGTLDRHRTANGAAGTTGTGLPGAGNLCFDGTNWRSAPCDTTGTPRVGRHTTAIKSAPTVQAAAYAAADLVGGKQTFTSAARVPGGSGVIRGILIGDQAANSAANSVYDLIIWDADPTGTTFTENAVLDVADADLNKTIAVVRFDGVVGSTLFSLSDNAVLYKAVEIPFQASGSANLFGALIARGAPTYAATTDVFVTLLIEQN